LLRIDRNPSDRLASLTVQSSEVTS
jgi:hypothetical protein